MRVASLTVASLTVASLTVASLIVGCGGGGGGGGGGSAGAQVTFSPNPLRPGHVTWTVNVTNDTDHALDLTFPTGQRADVTLSRTADVVYQWSRGMMFTQMIGHVQVPAGGTKAFTLDEPGLDVDPGVYQLHAVVTSSDHMGLSVTRQVTVERR